MQLPPFDAHMGIRILHSESGRVEIGLDMAPHHLNLRGVAHGGVVAYLLDAALGAAVVSAIPKQWWCATTSLSVQFIRGARGARLTACGRVVRRADHLAFAAGEVRDDDGRVVGSATGTWHLWPRRPSGPPPAEGPHVVMRNDGTRVPVGKILAVGRNYADHAAEMGARREDPPVLFLKPSTAIVQHGAAVPLPRDLGEVHHEAELVVAIGRRGRAVPEDRALEHVLGYAVGLDLTLRDVQREAKRRGEPWTLAKGFDGSAPVSAVAPRDEVGDVSNLEIRLRVNGEPRQQDSTRSMTRSVAELIAFASRWITLERGDLIFTGTPAGVGPVRPGDRVEASIDGVGTVAVTVVEEE